MAWIETGLANYAAAIDSAIETATAAVYKRFDVIAGILLGEVGSEKDDFEDAARLVRKSMDKNIHMSTVEEWQMDEIQKTVERRLGSPNLRKEK